MIGIFIKRGNVDTDPDIQRGDEVKRCLGRVPCEDTGLEGCIYKPRSAEDGQ